MTRLKFDLLMLDAICLSAPFLMLAALLWTSRCPAEEPGVFINGQRVVCDCSSCQCGPSCVCAGVCTCPTCKSRVQVQPFGNTEESPVEIVLVTAEEWCPACQILAPHWKAVSKGNPICRTLDISDQEGDDAKEARKYATRYNLPTLLRLVNGKKERSTVVAGMSEGQLRAVVGQWRGR